MKLFENIKKFFQKTEKQVEEQPTLAEVPKEQIEQPKGEILGFCSICGKEVFESEKSSRFQGNLVHKRCFKKAKKMAFSGQNLTNITLNQ